MVRGFARHLHALDPRCEVPAAGLLRCSRIGPVLHLYSDDEIRALMSAADQMSRQRLGTATYRTLIGLLACRHAERRCNECLPIIWPLRPPEAARPPIGSAAHTGQTSLLTSQV